MNITQSTKETLRDRGWSVARQKARRPPAVASDDILLVGEDVTFDEAHTDGRLVQLDDNR